MATTDRDLSWFLERSSEVAADSPPPRPGDVGRRSFEAFLANQDADPRDLASRGYLELTGPSVTGSRAELGFVGALASAWQKAVSATGAALEQVRGLRGALPSDITTRTTLLLNAAPQPGSIVLSLEPQTPAQQEVEPQGKVAMFDPPRPLADRASERLIQVLDSLRVEDLETVDAIASALAELGPRVGSAINTLAAVIQQSNFSMAAAWAEPGHDQVTARVTPTEATWVRDFIAGRGLDAEVRAVTGYLRTVSDRDRWLVELPDGQAERMDARELSESEVSRWRVGDFVRLTVRVALREQPDGVIRRATTILDVQSDEEEA